MNSITYALPEKIVTSPDLTSLLVRAEDAVARLDERARSSKLRDGWQQRLLFGEACACLDAERELVHLEDLVLLDGRAFDGAASPALSRAWHVLGVWRKAARGDAARLLALPRPGEEDAMREAVHEVVRETRQEVPDYFFEADRKSAERLAAWRRVLKGSRVLPPLVAAAVVWDAWLVLDPEERGAWRAPLIASLVLKARDKTRSLLLPIDSGRRHGKARPLDGREFSGRVAGFLEWCISAADRSAKEMDRLALVHEMLSRKLEGRRKNSRLGALIDLLMSRPLISIPLAAKALSCSPQAVAGMLDQLGSVPREMSGRKRYRVWSV